MPVSRVLALFAVALCLIACSSSASTAPPPASAPSAPNASAPNGSAPSGSAAPASVAASPSPDSLLQAGPMVGYGTHREVALWVQTTAPADVAVRYWSVTPDSVRERPGVVPDPDTSRTPTIRSAADGIARFTITALEPGNTYRYALYLDGARVDRPYPLRFQTQPLWQWRDDPPRFTLAIGSCAYVNEAVYDRPGPGYGGDYRIFETIAAQNPDAMLWLGDNVYYREVDWDAPAMMHRRYAHTRRLSEMQALLGHTHHYATWDDHDYGPNNSDRSYGLKDVALDVFKRYWANPQYGYDGVPGVFGRFTWADAEFFVLDDRYHRAPTTAPRDSQKTMFGDAQLQWLVDGLTSSEATFKVVVNGGQILNPATRHETLARFPQDRQRLLDAIVERQIAGVVFLSGDRHFTEMAAYQPDGLDYTLYEFTSSPLTAGAGGPRDEPNPYRIEETLVTETRNFGTLTFDGPCRPDDSDDDRPDARYDAGPCPARTLTMRTFDADGALLWERSIRASELMGAGE